MLKKFSKNIVVVTILFGLLAFTRTTATLAEAPSYDCYRVKGHPSQELQVFSYMDRLSFSEYGVEIIREGLIYDPVIIRSVQGFHDNDIEQKIFEFFPNEPLNDELIEGILKLVPGESARTWLWVEGYNIYSASVKDESTLANGFELHLGKLGTLGQSAEISTDGYEQVYRPQTLTRGIECEKK